MGTPDRVSCAFDQGRLQGTLAGCGKIPADVILRSRRRRRISAFCSIPNAGILRCAQNDRPKTVFPQPARLASSAPIAKRASARFRIHRDPMTRSLCHVLCCSLLLVSGAFPAQKEDLAAESPRAKQAMTEGRFEEAAAL